MVVVVDLLGEALKQMSSEHKHQIKDQGPSDLANTTAIDFTTEQKGPGHNRKQIATASVLS